MRVPFTKHPDHPRPEIFERWCEAEEPDAPRQTFDLDEYRKARRQENLEVLVEQFADEVRRAALPRDKKMVVHTSIPVRPSQSLTLDFSGTFAPRDLTPDMMSHLSHLSIDKMGSVQIVGGLIRQLYIRPGPGSVELDGCCIAQLEVQLDTRVDLILRRCWIGRLSLSSGAVRNMVVEGGSIRSIGCPPPDSSNPFSGSVSFHLDVFFPTSPKQSKLLQGAQGYRNLRAHLETLQNAPAANFMRSLELTTERHDDRGFTKVVSWAYGAFAAYGLWPGRPLRWALVLYLITASVILLFDGGTSGLQPDQYFGWQKGLTEVGPWGSLRRAVILPIQSVVNPFGLFGLPRLVVASTGWGQVLLTVQGLLTDGLLLMAIFGIRKRFKLP